MNTQTLGMFMRAKNINQSQLAAMAGVSRQAVSLWLKSPNRNTHINSRHLENLSRGLGVSMDRLTQTLPGLGRLENVASLQTTLLWDRLYPKLEDFIIAISRAEPRALARLVHVYGLFQSEKIAGKEVWTRFHEYKKYIHPVRCSELERIWNLQNRNLT